MLLAAVIAVIILIGAAAIGLTAAAAAQRRAQSTADLTALAAAQAILATGSGCAAGGAIAALNGARVLSCTTGTDASVTVTVQVTAVQGTMSATAIARAGPDTLAP